VMQSCLRRSNLVTNESSTDILSVRQAGVSPAEELVTRTKRDVRLSYSTGKMLSATQAGCLCYVDIRACS